MAADKSGELPSETKGALPAAAGPKHDLSVYPLSAALNDDTIAMCELRASLDAIASQYGEGTEPDACISLVRQHVIAVLESLHLSLKGHLARPENRVSDDEDAVEILLEHPTMSLLQRFIGVLADLGNAKTDSVLKATKKSRGASLTASEIRRRDEMLAFVDVLQAVEQLKTRSKAELALEKMLTKQGGRAKAVKAVVLKEWRKTRARQKRRTPK